MDYLRGKCIKATKTFQLSGKVVDGKYYSSSDFYIPRIQSGNIYLIEESTETTARLRSITSGEWDICELSLDDIEEFKIVSKDSM